MSLVSGTQRVPAVKPSLSEATRRLTVISGAAFALLGLVLYLAPAWAAPRFAWLVTPYITMTIGAWCLGNAVVAVHAARRWRWGSVYPLLFYLWSFSVLETLVLVRFRDKVALGASLAWPYFVALALGLAATGAGLVDLVRLRPPMRVEGAPAPSLLRALWGIFAVLVALIGLVAFVASDVLDRRVFPEPMTPFTLRALGGFYVALALGAASVVVARTLPATIAYTSGPSAFTILITGASIVYIRVFDFGAHPKQWIYLGAYLGALVIGLAVYAWAKTKNRSYASRAT